MTGNAVDGGLLSCDAPDIVLGIDQSYTGFALTAMTAEGEALFHSWLYVSTGTGVRRVISIRDFLDSVRRELRYKRIVAVAMEGYAPGARFGREMAGELGGMVKLWLFDTLFIEPVLVAPTALKKYVTGKGTKVQKNQMLLYTYKKWGVEFHDDNLCDSYALARVASGRYTLEYEAEVLNRLTR